jgi:phospholipid/cholesterol/gamma-HCH transport system substrate-binding protein
VANPARLAGVGLFVVGAVTLFSVAIFMIGSRHQAFSKRFFVYTEFAKITGLQKGSLVRVSGATGGEVTDIYPPTVPAGKFRVRMEVIEELHQLIRSDSVASIQTEGLVGGSYLAIATGSASAPEAPQGSVLPDEEPFDIGDLMQRMNETVIKVNSTIDEVRGEMDQTIGGIQETVSNANNLITSVGSQVREASASAANAASELASMTADLRAGKGTVGKLLTDDELYNRMTRIASNTESLTTDARGLMTDARTTLEQLNGPNGAVAGLTLNMDRTLDDARSAMSSLADNMDALHHNFLVRGFFESRGYFDLNQMTPAEYRSGALTDAGWSPVRIWLEAGRLFAPQSPAEDPTLSDTGRKRLDSALAPYLDRMGASVLMVEGFTPSGSRDVQFVVSRARAEAVRAYLIDRFHLQPRSTGAIPLGGESPGAPGTGGWDGVALAVFMRTRG